jgi:glycosyltransferase involved in cell wall biosynthesis
MVGMLEREAAVYQYLINRGVRVSFVTYGDASDLAYSKVLGKIEILCNTAGKPLEVYEQNILELHAQALADVDVIKTNQTYGARTAMNVARHLAKPLIARCGYMWSGNASREHGTDSSQAQEAFGTEYEVFSEADAVVVTTPAMEADVLSRIPQAKGKTQVIPNYVDTDLFRPMNRQRSPDTILFVGRIAPEKNLDNLLEAVAPLNVNVRIIGEGKLRPLLQERFECLGDRIVWEGNVQNKELPRYMNEATMFVLPSRYEGHPKALLEAMACGTPVIGGNAPGIREIINHGKTGLLSETDPLHLRHAVKELLKNKELRTQLGNLGREFVLEGYALPRIGAMELKVLRSLL